MTPKRSWPILLLASLSFIPLLGFFFTAATVTWALVSDRPRARLALIIAVIGGLLTVAEMGVLYLVGSRSEEFQHAQVEAVRDDLQKVVLALEDYRTSHHQYPADLGTLVGPGFPVRLLNVVDHSNSVFSQTPYHYLAAADGSYDLFAVGPDGVAGTADDVRPNLPDSVLRRSGFRPPVAPKPSATKTR